MSDMQDQSQSYQIQQQDRRNDNQSQQQIQRPRKSQYIVPDSKQKLRACIHCRLIKTDQQWKKSKRCQNCGDVVNNYLGQTTDRFNGIVSILSQGPSWIRRKNKISRNKLVMGAYAIKIDN